MRSAILEAQILLVWVSGHHSGDKKVEDIFIKVLGNSMKPSISSGDIIFINKDFNIKIGDIIFYKRGDKFFAHRTIFKGKDYFSTKGDKIPFFERVKIDEVLGKVIMVIKGNKIIDLEKKKFLNIFFLFNSLLFNFLWRMKRWALSEK